MRMWKVWEKVYVQMWTLWNNFLTNLTSFDLNWNIIVSKNASAKSVSKSLHSIVNIVKRHFWPKVSCSIMLRQLTHFLGSINANFVWSVSYRALFAKAMKRLIMLKLKNHIIVKFVESALHTLDLVSSTNKFTLVEHHLNANFVTSISQTYKIGQNMRKFTLEKNHLRAF